MSPDQEMWISEEGRPFYSEQEIAQYKVSFAKILLETGCYQMNHLHMFYNFNIGLPTFSNSGTVIF